MALNPNSKIPALLDRSTSPGTQVFESGAILLYLAEKFGEFLPEDPALKPECLSWLFWQMGSTPYVGGGFGHFYAYAPEKIEYCIDRFTMEVKRQLDVLLGRYADDQVIAPNTLPETPAEIPAGLPADLVARRPDLAAAERSVAASEARLQVARKELLPSISLTANTGTSTNALRSLLNGDFSVWGLVSNVVAPLWQGGRLRAQIDRAEAQAAEILATYVNTALVAYAEVETTLAAEAFLSGREQHLVTSVEQARAAERLADERYSAGLDAYITVLDSQRSAFQAEADLIAARRLRLDNRVDLYLALGGGFEQLDSLLEPKITN